MRILFIVPYVPNLIRVRPYNLIRYLAKRGHQVTVWTLWQGNQELDDVAQLSWECHRVNAFHLPKWKSLWNSMVTLPTREPLQASYCWQPEMARQLEAALHKNGNKAFDLVHVEHLRGVRYAQYIKAQMEHAAQGARMPVVWDSVDCITLLFKQAAAHSQSRLSRTLTRFELARTEELERKLPSDFERILVTSRVDKEAFISLTGKDNTANGISVIPNGVDLEYFHPDRTVDRDQASLIITGKMSYHANVTMVTNFMQNIYPHIQAKRPKVKVWIVGKDPPAVLREYSQKPGVKVTGTVTDIRPYLQRATVAVAPIVYGAGIQNKVLEAMACATPVVATSKAISAIEAQPGRVLLVADEPEEFAAHVLALLAKKELQRQVGGAGRRYVEENHNWGSIATQLEGVYHEVIYTKN